MATKIDEKEVLQLLPTTIAKSKRFTDKNKYLLATLLFLNGLDKVKNDGYFFRTNLMLSKEANIAEKNLLINLKKLEQLNFISRKAGKRGEASEYVINEAIIFSYDDKLTNDIVSNKVSDELDKVSNKASNKVSDKVSDKLDKVSNKASNKVSDKVSDKLDYIILRISNLEELFQQFILSCSDIKVSDKVSNKVDTKVSTDTDTDTDTEKEKEININNNILEKNLIEKTIEKNSDKECFVVTAHSNASNVVECLPSKSFSFSLKGKETNNAVIDGNNTSARMPLSSDFQNNNTKGEQFLRSMEKVADNDLKEEVKKEDEKEVEKDNNVSFSLKEKEDNKKSIELLNNDGRNIIPSNSNSDDFSCFVVEFSREEEEEKSNQNENKKKCIVDNAHILIDRLNLITSIEELVSKSILYVDWLNNQRYLINDDSLYQSLMNEGETVFGNVHSRLYDDSRSVETSKKESIIDDSCVFSFFDDNLAKTESKPQLTEAKLRVISTGEIITLEECLKRKISGYDVEDMNDLPRRKKSNYTCSVCLA